MNSFSFAESILMDKYKVLVFLHAIDFKQRAYFVYILADKSALKMLKQAYISSKEVELTKYGEIIAKGWGKPSQSLKDELHKKYSLKTDS